MAFTFNFSRFVDFKNVLRSFKQILRESFEIFGNLQVLLQFFDLLVFLRNCENLVTFQLLKLGKLFVEIALQLKNDLLNQLNLDSLSSIVVQFEWFVEQIVDVWTFDGQFQVVNTSARLYDPPMDLFHALDVPLARLVLQGGQASLLIRVSLASFSAQFALGQRQNGLHLVIVPLLLIHVQVV